eukprot:15358965-Ditylum_brightwellii.AAC.1
MKFGKTAASSTGISWFNAIRKENENKKRPEGVKFNLPSPQPRYRERDARSVHTRDTNVYDSRQRDDETIYTEYTDARTEYTEDKTDYGDDQTMYTEYTEDQTQYTEDQTQYTEGRTEYADDQTEFTDDQTEYTEDRTQCTDDRT